jgi:hypothetical protein
MSKEFDHLPVQKTFFEVRKFLNNYYKRTGIEAKLPTAHQLKNAHIYGQIIVTGPEWTQEGFIYNPSTKKINMSPSSSSTATFRLVSGPNSEWLN